MVGKVDEKIFFASVESSEAYCSLRSSMSRTAASGIVCEGREGV